MAPNDERGPRGSDEWTEHSKGGRPTGGCSCDLRLAAARLASFFVASRRTAPGEAGRRRPSGDWAEGDETDGQANVNTTSHRSKFVKPLNLIF